MIPIATTRVLVTGGTGFVGFALAERLARDHPGRVRVSTRRAEASVPAGVERVVVDELGPLTNWTAALADVGTVVHVAARAHVLHDVSEDPLALYRRVNTEGTLRLARQAVDAGVRRFVFISSIKVNGEATVPGRPFDSTTPPKPTDPYGVSKLEAELGLAAIAARTGLEVVTIRPVLVYGPRAKGNIRTMMRWLQRGVPLPFAAIRNARSLVALDNLVDLISTSVVHPAAANQLFMVSDGEDLSTPELLRRMAAAMGVRSRLVPVPASWILGAARLTGLGGFAQRLCGSLQVDIQRTRDRLGWTPPVSVEAALARAARDFREGRP